MSKKGTGNTTKYSPTEIPEPWERQPQEPAKAFEAFCLYRDMKPKERSVEKVGQKQGKRWTGYMRDWSAKWKWVSRAAEYDSHMDKQARELDRKEREEMSKLHIKAARAMLTKALQGLQAIPPEEMSANDISRMIEVSSKLERLSRGESTESVETFGKEGAPPAVQIYLPSNGREKKND